MAQKNVSINSPFLPRDNKERFELIELYLTDLKRRLAILGYVVETEKLERLILSMSVDISNVKQILDSIKESEGNE